ncbi:unnamed protein product [Lathyrus sativus]|nr:unnamed protein product [Lathyrus sativus]
MLKCAVHFLGLVKHTEENPKGIKGTKAPPKDSVVRTILKGGKQEVYEHTFPASKLMAKYPGMCVALPQVFKYPHQSLLLPEDHLLLGHKYIVISCKDVKKLKRKHPECKIYENEGKVNANMNLSQGGEDVKESYCYANGFCYDPKGNKSTRYSIPKGIKGKKPFVQPLPKEKL